jgi:hypothetical protein
LIPCFGAHCVWECRNIPKIVNKKYTTFSIEWIVALQSVHYIFTESYGFAADMHGEEGFFFMFLWNILYKQSIRMCVNRKYLNFYLYHAVWSCWYTRLVLLGWRGLLYTYDGPIKILFVFASSFSKVNIENKFVFFFHLIFFMATNLQS